VTLDQLKRIMPHAKQADEFYPFLVAAMREFEINTPQRQAAFLAQICHESGSLRYVKEIATGGAYEGRADLGNTEQGDGIKYKGRGLIQITGRYNYRDCGTDLGLPLVDNPELLEDPENACRSAGWFWQTRGLNELADQGDFVRITKRINGGTNGLMDRQEHWDRARRVLGC
jgi:putative chitinase